MEQPFDQYLSSIWNTTMPDAPQCSPEHTWSACRILSSEGYLVPNRQSLGLAAIGPFKIAVTAAHDALFDSFLHGGAPLVFKGLCKEITLADALESVLVSAVSLLVALAKTSARITDPESWLVLTFVREQNKKGIFPSVSDVADVLAANCEIKELAHTEEILSRLKTTEALVSASCVCPFRERRRWSCL